MGHWNPAAKQIAGQTHGIHIHKQYIMIRNVVKSESSSAFTLNYECDLVAAPTVLRCEDRLDVLRAKPWFQLRKRLQRSFSAATFHSWLLSIAGVTPEPHAITSKNMLGRVIKFNRRRQVHYGCIELYKWARAG